MDEKHGKWGKKCKIQNKEMNSQIDMEEYE